MARVLVTGATGFIGRHLVPRLVERGDHVCCLVRSPGWPNDLSRTGVAFLHGDIALRTPLDEAVRNIDIVYHLAGATLPTQGGIFRRVNTEGTRRLAEACARQLRPPVFIYVSSIAAAGPARAGLPLTETMPPRPVSEYGRSKLAAERSLQAVADRLPATVLRPPIVFGPGDAYTVKLFRLARRGVNLVPGPTLFHVSLIAVSDLVEAMILAADRGQRLAPLRTGPPNQGLYYVALDDQPSMAEVARLLAEVQGRPAPRTRHIPAFLCWLAARVNDFRAPFAGRAYWLNSDKLREALAGSWICTADKAKRELGFTCLTDLAGGFRLTSQWYYDQGWL